LLIRMQKMHPAKFPAILELHPPKKIAGRRPCQKILL
jgi:hypothetical protein